MDYQPPRELRDITGFRKARPDDLVQVAYSSMATTFLTPGDLSDIRLSAELNNSAQNIHGVLVTDGTRILQILEGAASRLWELMDRIAADSRHERMRIFAFSQNSSRSYGEWTMAVRDVSGADRESNERFNGIYEVFRKAPISLELTPERLNFFRKFAEWQGHHAK